MDLKTAYAILELEPGSPPPELKRAYRTLVRAWHPDHHHDRPQLRRHCEERMRRINEAYDYLQEIGPFPPSFVPPPAATAPPPAAEPSEAAAEPPPEASPAPDPRPRRDFPLDPRRWVRAPRAAALRMPKLGGLDYLGIACAASTATAVFYFFLREPMPGYLDVLRMTLCASALYGAFAALERRLWDFVFALCCLALVLNPVTPLPFSPLEWGVLNLMTPSFFLYVWVTLLQFDSRASG